MLDLVGYAVAESNRAALRNLLLAGYEDFAQWLTRRLGSSELAREALQDTFLRLESGTEIGPVRSPKAYLLRMALNIAANRRVSESRRLSVSETDMLLEIADEAPGPARAAEARSEIEVLKRALNELPARRREIFIASWMDEISHQEIARRFGITVRTVQIELKDALEHCLLRLKRQ